uniref:Uncharacterized protein n=1 Tax=Lepeophtheirus salmonis TaxID=72036 RepID=A0A0K2UIA2_LEPSM
MNIPFSDFIKFVSILEHPRKLLPLSLQMTLGMLLRQISLQKTIQKSIVLNDQYNSR